MKVVSCDEMRDIDGKTIEVIGIPGIVLMENAGLQVVSSLEENFPELPLMTVLIIAGKGNNGGDGFVAARHLYNMGADVTTVLLGKRDEVEGDASTNLDIMLNMGMSVDEVTDLEGWEELSYLLYENDIVVDAIFGTGLKGAVRGVAAEVIKDINVCDAFVLAVDIPSGLSGDTAEIEGEAVIADLTVTMAFPKYAHVLPPAEDLAGELVVADIGVPEKLSYSVPAEFVDEDYVRPRLKERMSTDHKGACGHVGAFAGSAGKPGAASMICKGALKSGTGLATAAVPSPITSVVNTHCMELMTEALPASKNGFLTTEALEAALDLASEFDAAALGPGLGRDDETESFIRSFVDRCDRPMVIDADGVNAYEGRRKDLKNSHAPIIATPHPGEMARLFGVTAGDIQKDRTGYARKLAGENGIYVVLKGYRTVTATPKGKIFINGSGNPGMATGGSGDALTGIIAGLLAQEYKPYLAAVIGVYLHGLAGDFAAEILGMEAMTAGDILRFLPDAFTGMDMELDV